MTTTSLHIFLSLLQLIACAACLITKKISDSRAEQILRRNQKISNEWVLLNNLHWTQAGNDFSLVTYGGYTLIVAVLFLSRIISYNSKSGLFTKLLLTVGVAFFFLQGGLILASVEHTREDIHPNAFTLGGLSFVAALLMLIDVCCFGETPVHIDKTSQTENIEVYTRAKPIEATPAVRVQDVGIVERIDSKKLKPYKNQDFAHASVDSRSKKMPGYYGQYRCPSGGLKKSPDGKFLNTEV